MASILSRGRWVNVAPYYHVMTSSYACKNPKRTWNPFSQLIKDMFASNLNWHNWYSVFPTLLLVSYLVVFPKVKNVINHIIFASYFLQLLTTCWLIFMNIYPDYLISQWCESYPADIWWPVEIKGKYTLFYSSGQIVHVSMILFCFENWIQ